MAGAGAAREHREAVEGEAGARQAGVGPRRVVQGVLGRRPRARGRGRGPTKKGSFWGYIDVFLKIFFFLSGFGYSGFPLR